MVSPSIDFTIWNDTIGFLQTFSLVEGSAAVDETPVKGRRAKETASAASKKRPHRESCTTWERYCEVSWAAFLKEKGSALPAFGYVAKVRWVANNHPSSKAQVLIESMELCYIGPN